MCDRYARTGSMFCGRHHKKLENRRFITPAWRLLSNKKTTKEFREPTRHLTQLSAAAFPVAKNNRTKNSVALIISSGYDINTQSTSSLPIAIPLSSPLLSTKQEIVGQSSKQGSKKEIEYTCLGAIDQTLSKLDMALEQYQSCLAVQLATLGPYHPDVATSYNNIGHVYRTQGKYDLEFEHHQKRLAITYPPYYSNSRGVNKTAIRQLARRGGGQRISGIVYDWPEQYEVMLEEGRLGSVPGHVHDSIRLINAKRAAVQAQAFADDLALEVENVENLDRAHTVASDDFTRLVTELKFAASKHGEAPVAAMEKTTLAEFAQSYQLASGDPPPYWPGEENNDWNQGLSDGFHSHFQSPESMGQKILPKQDQQCMVGRYLSLQQLEKLWLF